MVYEMANLAHQHVGILPSSVVLEFVYGATVTLVKYSTFLPEETSRQPSASALDSSVVGIGVEIKPHDEGVEVVKALKGGPAEAGGLQAGDIIVGINGKSLRGQNLNFAVDQIAGPINTPIYLTVVRNGRQLSPMTLTRREVKILSVSEVRMMGQQRDVGYIKLDKFAQSSGKEIDEALMNLHRSGMQSLVLDLRGNPGGLLTTAIELSNKFLPSGTIVSTRGRTTQDNMQEKASNTQTWKVPLVVLIDENSASASEIFAAAIQENCRGVIVGRQSYGKGTVQTHFPLRSVGGNLKLTTAKFYSPKGREMANAGVTPDVQVTATSYRGTPSTADQDIQSALEVAQSGRVRDYLAATPRPSYQIGR
jgi:carboxyl-terminal processing protease